MQTSHLGKRKILEHDASPPPSVLPTRLDERANPEHSPSLMRFFRSLFRPNWEGEGEEGGPPEDPKRPKTETAVARTHCKEVHQRRRRHKRTNSLSSISQLSHQVVFPARRLDLRASTGAPEPAVRISVPAAEPTEMPPGKKDHFVVRKTNSACRSDDSPLHLHGDNADGPCVAATGTTVHSRAKRLHYTKSDRIAEGGGTDVPVDWGIHANDRDERYVDDTDDTTEDDQPTGAPIHEERKGAAVTAIITSVEAQDLGDDEYGHRHPPAIQATQYDTHDYIRNLPPRSSLSHYERRILLPPLHLQCLKKPTLVLDLDETLVHSTIEPPPPGSPPPDHVFSVTLESITYNVFVRVRPNMYRFLAEVAPIFELVVFTASQEAYAGRLLDMLDPQRYICHRLYRDACLFVDGNFIKDLDMLGRDLQRTTIVDNSPVAFAYHQENGIPIESWFGEQSDDQLLALVPFLRELALADDVRPLLRKKYMAVLPDST